MEQRISLVTLGVADLARARAFYEALGWGGAKQPDDEVCFFQAGGMVFGLWTALGGHGAPGVELAHNVRSPEAVGTLLAEAERAGGTIVRPSGPPRRGPCRGGQVAACRPNGSRSVPHSAPSMPIIGITRRSFTGKGRGGDGAVAPGHDSGVRSQSEGLAREEEPTARGGPGRH